jgi:hypothetical protein
MKSTISQYAQFVDLDGPLLIRKDRNNGFEFHQGLMQPLNRALWGGADSVIR